MFFGIVIFIDSLVIFFLRFYCDYVDQLNLIYFYNNIVFYFKEYGVVGLKNLQEYILGEEVDEVVREYIQQKYENVD